MFLLIQPADSETLVKLADSEEKSIWRRSQVSALVVELYGTAKYKVFRKLFQLCGKQSSIIFSSQ